VVADGFWNWNTARLQPSLRGPRFCEMVFRSSAANKVPDNTDTKPTANAGIESSTSRSPVSLHLRSIIQAIVERDEQRAHSRSDWQKDD